MPPFVKQLLLLLFFFTPMLFAQTGQATLLPGGTTEGFHPRGYHSLCSADFPLEAMQQKLPGHVVIHLVVSTSGDVLSADPVSGNPIFTQSVVAAMRR